MLYSCLLYKKYLLVDFQAEQLFLNIEKNDTIEQDIISLKTLTSSCLGNIINNLKLIRLVEYQNVIIDLAGIINSHNLDFSFETIIEYFRINSKNIYVINVHEELYKQLKLSELIKTHEIKEVINKTKEENSWSRDFLAYSFHIKSKKLKSISTDSLLKFKYELYSQMLYNKLLTKKSYYGNKKNKLSNSSDVYLDKYVNIKAFIEDKPFSYYGLFLLSKKIMEIIKKEEISKQVLFTMSINGSYLAAVIAKLIGTDISYVDHLGPINKIYKTQLDKRINTVNKYIIVSDVICLGTEIKIAESIINYENAIVNGYVTIVNIKTVTKEQKAPLISLFEINSDTNKKLKYSIKTELDKK